MDERIDEGVLRWFSCVERVYVGVCAGSHLVGRLWMRWIDTVKDCFRKRFGCQASKENCAE